MAVCEALPRYRPSEVPAMAFIYGIARNKVADSLRASGRDKSDPTDEVPDRISTAVEPEVGRTALVGRPAAARAARPAPFLAPRGAGAAGRDAVQRRGDRAHRRIHPGRRPRHPAPGADPAAGHAVRSDGRNHHLSSAAEHADPAVQVCAGRPRSRPAHGPCGTRRRPPRAVQPAEQITPRDVQRVVPAQLVHQAVHQRQARRRARRASPRRPPGSARPPARAPAGRARRTAPRSAASRWWRRRRPRRAGRRSPPARAYGPAAPVSAPDDEPATLARSGRRPTVPGPGPPAAPARPSASTRAARRASTSSMQREQAGDLAFTGHEAVQDAGEPDRLVGEVGAQEIGAAGGGVALGEDQVDDAQHAGQPGGQLVGGRAPGTGCGRRGSSAWPGRCAAASSRSARGTRGRPRRW